MLELTEKDKALIRTASIEHMINTTIRLVERLRRSSNASVAEGAQNNWQDWKECGGLICKLWERERDNLYRESQILGAVASLRLQKKDERDAD
jgi:hypothetical protein